MAGFIEKITRFIPASMKQYIISSHLRDSNASLCYSQEGEDMLLDRLLNKKKKGFFVDVGAHHPTRFSNTYMFYKRGWRGINIDAMPGSMNLFRKERPEDINLEIPIGASRQSLTYHIFNEPALNTFSKDEAVRKDGLGGYRIIEEIPMEVHPLGDILDTHVSAGTQIDFLSIDVEGLDYEVLFSNNWDKYNPTIILVECLKKSYIELQQDKIYSFLEQKGYEIVAKTFNTVFFRSMHE